MQAKVCLLEFILEVAEAAIQEEEVTDVPPIAILMEQWDILPNIVKLKQHWGNWGGWQWPYVNQPNSRYKNEQ